MASEIVEMEGHLIDSGQLSKVLDLIVTNGASYTTLDFSLGEKSEDVSSTRIEVRMPTDAALERLLIDLQLQGANRVEVGTAITVACDQAGVLPAGFFSTSNLPTSVRLTDHWIPVENPEMDCAIVILPDGRVRTKPMHQVLVGEQIVVGHNGVRIELPAKLDAAEAQFEFMNSDASPEKPKGLIVKDLARRIRAIKNGNHSSGKTKVAVVCGPAVIHTGAAPALARMVRAGFIDVLFAGNGFATHDMESNVMGTSLGVSVTEGRGMEGGHSNHLRVINEIRRYGSIAAAVGAGYIGGGVMYELVKAGKPFVLAGSVRDDGPLPDVMTNVVEAADAMRDHVDDMALAMMFSTTLHAIATGNILPAAVETFCVDINQSVVTKLNDRGSHQAIGVVTDVGLFINALADELCGPAVAAPDEGATV